MFIHPYSDIRINVPWVYMTDAIFQIYKRESIKRKSVKKWPIQYILVCNSHHHYVTRGKSSSTTNTACLVV